MSTEPTTQPAEVLNAEEVPVFLRVDRKTVYDYANRGLIPHRRLGKRLLLPVGGGARLPVRPHTPGGCSDDLPICVTTSATATVGIRQQGVRHHP